MSTKSIAGKTSLSNYIDYFSHNVEMPKKLVKQVSKFSFDKKQHKSMDRSRSDKVLSSEHSFSRIHADAASPSKQKSFVIKKSGFSRNILEDNNLSSNMHQMSKSSKSIRSSSISEAIVEVRKPSFSKLLNNDSYVPIDESRYSMPKHRKRNVSFGNVASKSLLK